MRKSESGKRFHDITEIVCGVCVCMGGGCHWFLVTVDVFHIVLRRAVLSDIHSFWLITDL